MLGVSISVGVEERGEAGTDASINTSTDLPKKKKKKKKGTDATTEILNKGGARLSCTCCDKRAC